MARKALLVGINQFQSINGLNGCINDITNMRDILKSFYRFENNDIHMLADSRATKKAIEDKLHNMIEKAKPGDLLVFHLSSHGSQIRDRHGDELSDGMDELFCPYDMDWNGTYLLDDDLALALKKLPKDVELEILFDTCHSGTGTRGCDLRPPCEFPTKYRYTPPPVDILSRSDGDENLPVRKLFTFAKKKSLTKTREVGETDDRLIVAIGHILWAGCKDSQTSADAYIKGSYNGAFTYYFCKHIRESNGKIIRPELLKRVRASLKYEGYDQVVQMETNKANYYNLVFGGGN